MKKIVLGLGMLFAMFSLTATAQSGSGSGWVAGVGYAHVTDDSAAPEYDFGLIYGSLGYKVNVNDGFYINERKTH